ncbi:uncharacterized protein DUF3887 [Ezakiella coagulans]|uniref:Uncharacterized protein DUF3887 n=1 Tax=Ezakiella coagulans TaxID=46507 RepID=A0A2U1E1I3_9FIRM|nr:DUF3887 domain-containing protein [Ezakiella coagulans]PVY93800.1 uncharacterized protein DUF3887 [Ezakiella coagulans]
MKRLFLIAVLAVTMTFSACKTNDTKVDDKKVETTEDAAKTDEKDNKENEDKKDDKENKVEEAKLDEEKKKTLEEKTKTLTELLAKRDFDKFKESISEEFKKATEGQDLDVFKMLEQELGAYKEIVKTEIETQNGYYLTDSTLQFEKGTVDQTIAFNGEMVADGVNYLNMKKDIVPEEGEKEITLDAGTGYPVKGMIKMPKGEVKAGIVIVDGSGPNDMNMTLGQNKMMKHLSDQLAEKGFAVLRFNKRTYQYGKELAKIGMQNKTLIKDEFIDDAAEGLKTLAKEQGIPTDKLFILGHSQSGSYLPVINETAGNLAKGYIILSGTPTNIAELSKKQLEKVIEEGSENADEEQVKMMKQNIKTNDELLKKIETMSDEELNKPENYPFGIPGVYVKDLMKYDPIKLYNDSKLPIFIKIAEFDKQVPVSELELWKNGLDKNENDSIEEVKGANHMMQPSDGKTKLANLITDEYQKDAPIVSSVIDDIAAWIEKITK